jgi:hypothetical protein
LRTSQELGGLTRKQADLRQNLRQSTFNASLRTQRIGSHGIGYCLRHERQRLRNRTGTNLISANTGEQLLTTTIRRAIPPRLGEVYE